MPRRHRVPSVRALAVVLGLATVMSACTSATNGHGSATDAGKPAPGSSSASQPSPGSSASTLPDQPRANFSDCRGAFNLGLLSFPPGREARLSFDCATISVPLDYDAPTGKTIILQLVKIHDSANTAHTGDLLVNPGGPGGSGVELGAGLSARLSDRLLSHFDLIGFDPRGVGSSSPLRCLTDAQKDVLNAASPDVLTTGGFTAAKASARMVSTACTNRYGSDLAQYDTVQTAKDMDRIRQAVGDPKMNYLGFSYGTELGSVYAHLFPNNVRVAVLDGAVDPVTDDITSFADQLQGFEGAFDQFAGYCRVHNPCSTLGDPRAAVYRVARHATARPIPSAKPGETRKATSSNVYTGVLSALYSQAQWPALGQALLDAQQGNAEGIFTLADQYDERVAGHYKNIADANTTIGCNDSKPGPSDATIRATAKSWKTRFPIFGAWSAPSLFSCQQWQPDRTPVPLPSAATSRKVLVIGNLHDPATPYRGAKDLVKAMGNAELLTWDGEGHTSFLQGSRCIDDYVDDYLVDATLPPPNTTCPR